MRLLLVEDEDSLIEVYKAVLKDYVEKHGRSILMDDEKTIKDAKQRLDSSIDAAVVDLNLGGDTRDGGEVIEEVKEHFRMPVAVLTGTPADADDQPPVVGVFTKGEHSFADVLDRLWAVHEVGLTKIMGGRGLLEDRLNKLFLNNLVPMIDVWIGYGEGNPKRTEKALLRYALGHLVADLEGDETPSYPEEFYLDPPLEASLTTGSLLQHKDDGMCHVVMTPACDLVVRSNGKRKAESIVLAAVVSEAEVYALPGNSGQQKRLRQNSHSNCYHWMPKAGAMGGGFLDFRRLETVPLGTCEEKYKCLKVRIAPSFVKDIVSRFSLFYARQGQPAIDDGVETT